MLNRREAMLSMLFGAGFVGLLSHASGIPAAILLNPRRAMASTDAGAPAFKNPQSVLKNLAQDREMGLLAAHDRASRVPV